MIVTLIAAFAEGNRGIGLRGALPWRLPADLAMFRESTMGHAVIMGRVTYASLPGPLDGRRLIVLTRSRRTIPGVEIAQSIPGALGIAADDPDETETYIAGGGQVYAQALTLGIVDRMRLTVVHARVKADTFFPVFDAAHWREIHRERHEADSKHAHAFTFLTLEKSSEPI